MYPFSHSFPILTSLPTLPSPPSSSTVKVSMSTVSSPSSSSSSGSTSSSPFPPSPSSFSHHNHHHINGPNNNNSFSSSSPSHSVSLSSLSLSSSPSSSFHSSSPSFSTLPINLISSATPSSQSISILSSSTSSHFATSSPPSSSLPSSPSLSSSSSPSPSPSSSSSPSFSLPSPSHPRRALIISGLISGVICSGLFNFYDRALYLSVVHHRPFLNRLNFDHPMRGFYQSMVHRTLSGGLYFPLFDLFHTQLADITNKKQISLSPFVTHFLSGNVAGGVLGVFLNQLTSVKYASWETNLGFLSTCHFMWREGGISPFFKGIVPTVFRDTVFGGSFALVKYLVCAQLPKGKKSEFVGALVGGTIGTAVSSPFNYVRNVKYSWKHNETPPGTVKILKDLATECRESPHFFVTLRERLRVGWGTLRVAMGMAVGFVIYEYCKDYQQKDGDKSIQNEKKKEKEKEKGVI